MIVQKTSNIDNIDDTVLLCLENTSDVLDDKDLAYFTNPAITVDDKLSMLNEMCKIHDISGDAVNIL